MLLSTRDAAEAREAQLRAAEAEAERLAGHIYDAAGGMLLSGGGTLRAWARHHEASAIEISGHGGDEDAWDRWHRAFPTAIMRIMDARGLLEATRNSTDPALLPAVNATVAATAGARAAHAHEFLLPPDLAPRVGAVGRATSNLGLAMARPNTTLPWADPGAAQPPHDVGALARALQGSAADLTRAVAGASHNSTDIVRAELVNATGTPRVRVTLAGRIPHLQGGTPPWVLEACAFSEDGERRCVVSNDSSALRYRLQIDLVHGGVSHGAWEVEDNHTIAMDAPAPTNQTTLFEIRVRSQFATPRLQDACRLIQAANWSCDDGAGDVGDYERYPHNTPSPRANLSLSLEVNETAFRNGTLTGDFVITNTGATTYILPLDPGVTLHVNVTDAATGEEVPWHRSNFGGPAEAYDDIDIVRMSGMGRFERTFPGGWLVEPNRTYEVVATYVPANAEDVTEDYWTEPLRSEPVTVRT